MIAKIDASTNAQGKHFLGIGADAPVRRYTMDEVWHGMTLGKNGDGHPRPSRFAEHAILSAESLAATVSLLGRPYSRWDVYPTWELEQAWRGLLAGQHHDNHECEGLCGSIGREHLRQAGHLACEVIQRLADMLGRRLPGDGEQMIVNRSAWPRRYPYLVSEGRRFARHLTDAVPPLGFALPHLGATRPITKARYARLDKSTLRIEREALQVDIDTKRGLIVQIRSAAFPQGWLPPDAPLLRLKRRVGGAVDHFQRASVEIETDPLQAGKQNVSIIRLSDFSEEEYVHICVGLDDTLNAILLGITDETDRPDPGFAGALRLHIALAFDHVLEADTPGAVDSAEPRGSFRCKYPKGEWMTSPQWFETIDKPFTARHFVAFRAAAPGNARGVAYFHDGAQQFMRTQRGAEHILSVYNPWDERGFGHSSLKMQMLIWPFAQASRADLIRRAHEHNFNRHNEWHRINALQLAETVDAPDADVPLVFGPLSIEGAPGVLAAAFYRESSKSGEHLSDWAGHEMARCSDGACTHPFIIRLIEYDGVEAEVTLKLVGPVASAAKTNLMGEVGGHVACGEDTRWLNVEPAEPPEWSINPNTGRSYEFRGLPLEWSQVRFRMRPHEIATVYADMVMGRKEYRDLDAKREVWATAHREQPPSDRP